MDIKIHSICRICVNNKEDLVNIFEEGLSALTKSFSFVEIIFNNSISQYICKICLEELQIATKFKEKCEKSIIKFYEFIDSMCLKNADTLQLKKIVISEAKSENHKIDDLSSFIEPQAEENFNTGFTHVENVFTKQENDKIITDTEAQKCNIKIRLKCKKCTETFVKQLDLEEHMKINHSMKENTFQCEYCGKIAKCRADLIKHMTLHTNERPHKCETCGKTFRLRSFLVKHNVTHGGARNHHCYYCPKSFALKSSLNSHLKTHTGEKKFTCNICNKKFKSSRSLYYHIKLHTEERNFPCTQCEKAFVNKFDLHRHLKLHEKYQQIKDGTYDKTKEPPKQYHQCEQCGKFFPSHSDLKKHFRIHSGEKPFKCSFCEKTFTGSSALKVHVRTHTGNKPYKCQFCDQCFAQSSNLKVHVRLHTDDRPYVCTVCDKRFNRKRDLEAHGKIHPIIPEKVSS